MTTLQIEVVSLEDLWAALPKDRLVKERSATIDGEKVSIPVPCEQEVYRQLSAAYSREISIMLADAQKCQAPRIIFQGWDQWGHQWTAHFALSDTAAPRGNQFNWHGQNTSQWRWAGALLWDDRSPDQISSHH